MQIDRFWKHILSLLLDTLFPQTPEEMFDRQIHTSLLRNRARQEAVTFSHRVPCSQLWAPFPYTDPVIQHALHGLKYRHNTFLAPIIAQALYNVWIEDFSEELTMSSVQELIILPIPLSKKRLRERGFNQSELIAQSLTTLLTTSLKVVCDTQTLRRVRDIPSQTNYTRIERFKNIHNCFEVVHPNCIAHTSLLIIDDIITTGATMHEACRVLRTSNPGNIYCLAVAH